MEGDDRSLMAYRGVVLWGGRSQAKVLRAVMERVQLTVIAIFDDTPELQSPFPDVPLLPGREFETWAGSQTVSQLGFAIAVGNPHGRARLLLGERMARAGLSPLTIIDPRASVDATARIGAGCQIFAGAVVSAEAQIGDQSIINCQALVEHETVIGRGVEIGPAAIVLGLAQLGDCATIGAHATVLARVRIGADAIVGAGHLVAEDLPPGAIAYGESKRIF